MGIGNSNFSKINIIKTGTYRMFMYTRNFENVCITHWELVHQSGFREIVNVYYVGEVKKEKKKRKKNWFTKV